MKEVSLLKLISFILTGVLIITSCNDVDCPSFPSQDEDWLPYALDDKIELINEIDTIKLLISGQNTSSTYSIRKNCDCRCEAYHSFITNIDSFNLISIESSIIYSDEIVNKIIPPVIVEIYEYEILNEDYLVPVNKDSFSCFNDSLCNFQDSTLLFRKMFKNVLTLRNNNNINYKEIVIIKGMGIFQITDKFSNIWYKHIE